MIAAARQALIAAVLLTGIVATGCGYAASEGPGSLGPTPTESAALVSYRDSDLPGVASVHMHGGTLVFHGVRCEARQGSFHLAGVIPSTGDTFEVRTASDHAPSVLSLVVSSVPYADGRLESLTVSGQRATGAAVFGRSMTMSFEAFCAPRPGPQLALYTQTLGQAARSP